MLLALSTAMALNEVVSVMLIPRPVESTIPLATRIAPVRGGVLLLPPPQAAFATTGKQQLPNVARNGGRLAAQWHRESALGGVNAETSVRYVGRSMLGVGELLDIPQGNYFVTDADTRLDLGRFTVSLSLDNIGNVRANTFAFGNPFGLAQRNQVTPLRPRTLRLGVEARF